MTVGRHVIVKSYRDLYRQALRAVQYSSPARYTLKSHLRLAYRSNGADAFSSPKIENTLLFLKHAAEERGLEHRMLKNLLHVWWWQSQSSKQKKESTSANARARNVLGSSTFEHFNVTLKILNESMGTCLPERELDAQAFDELDQWKHSRFFDGL
ncbi:MAG: hypothetical protein Q9186_004335 [Xanthomendoza sp. 1 TL-2023]